MVRLKIRSWFPNVYRKTSKWAKIRDEDNVGNGNEDQGEMKRVGCECASLAERTCSARKSLRWLVGTFAASIALPTPLRILIAFSSDQS